jgi:hypothetical protein
VLLEIDGHKVSNQGTVDLPDIGNCIDLIHVTQSKFIGDKVRLKILRRNESKGISEAHDIEVILDQVPYDHTIVPQTEYDKVPTYYINSGFVFAPVSRNFLEGPGSDLEDTIIIDQELGSYRIGDMPKKSADQQFVAISNVLDCPTTESFDRFTHELIKKVNGVEITNFSILILILESNRADTHEIELKDGRIIALKKLSNDEHNSILRKHKIAFDRSEELRLHPASTELTNKDDRDSTFYADDSEELIDSASSSQEQSVVKNTKSLKKSALLQDLEDSEEDDEGVSLGSQDTKRSSEDEEDLDESDEEDVVILPKSSHHQRVIQDDSDVDRSHHKKSLFGRKAPMDGQRRFMQYVDNMEARYTASSSHGVNDKVIDWDRMTDEAELDEDYEPSKHRSSSKSSSKKHALGSSSFSLFATKNHKGDDHDHENHHSTTKRRKLG